jgi:hypothetical protein
MACMGVRSQKAEFKGAIIEKQFVGNFRGLI